MKRNELKSMLFPQDPLSIDSDSLPAKEQALLLRHKGTYWPAFGAAFVLSVLVFGLLTYSPGQDHVASIPLNGDGAWYYNYEVGFTIQDQDIFYHGIGHSIDNARNADIIFLGQSTLIYGLDWRSFDEFERKHHLRMFNMGFAGVDSGEFSRRIIQKFDLHPKLWIINAHRYLPDNQNGFFYRSLDSAAGIQVVAVTQYGRLWALKNVVGRNIRWRAKMLRGSLRLWSYRSARTGNWYLDDWPNYSLQNPRIELRELHRGGAAGLYETERTNFACPTIPEEVDNARGYVKEIGSAVVLIQVPGKFTCAQRIHELAAALNASALIVDPTEYTTIDHGMHLDAASAQKYTRTLLSWLEQLPEFQRLFTR